MRRHTPRLARPLKVLRKLTLPVVALTAAALLLTTTATAAPAPSAVPVRPVASAATHEIVTWGASADRMGEAASDRGYRLVVRTSAGGTRPRVRLSNAFGDRPLSIGRAYAGVQKEGAALVRGSNRPLSFGGARSVTVPAGGTVLSDPLPGRLPAATALVISLYVAEAGGPATGHGMAMQTSYTTTGDHAAEEGPDNWTATTGSWFYLDAVTVRTTQAVGAVVALGDSITDGWQSSTDKDRRWPDYLARRLQSDADSDIEGVANEGISGNKVLADGAGQSALNRLGRDVLSHPGVRTILLFEGVNDIKAHTGVTAADLIDGYRRIIDRAHSVGVCVVGATVGPFKGWSEWDAPAEAVRREVNEFIRSGGEFDAVADFDRILRSPYDHERILPFFDNGDHLHPNDTGMRAMADAVRIEDLSCARDTP
ncbi:SGNH/GDSL hydrolase family protein [Streptomyces sp. ME02-8801-2C]|uniref:SGNH/GDSL hydrolase family protein n=1 Tax=Streptomyces sp. ME02-8801-2C TaxID=3028680 RepID=UPI0029ACEC2E|nr:SGNH/GDSL hydrolase family protein [Streptomyces sp. ME02-8801-2C]MDX3452529.1 SGNH/GDSL hydrolase family protein [Streptomyces sp. ME02-8801-2C]